MESRLKAPRVFPMVANDNQVHEEPLNGSGTAWRNVTAQYVVARLS